MSAQELKEMAGMMMDNPKVQGSISMGTMAAGGITANDVLFWMGFVSTSLLIIKLLIDCAKSVLDIQITKAKEEDRKKRLREAEEAGYTPRRKNELD